MSCTCDAATRLLVVQKQIEAFKILITLNPSLTAATILPFLETLIGSGCSRSNQNPDHNQVPPPAAPAAVPISDDGDNNSVTADASIASSSEVTSTVKTDKNDCFESHHNNYHHDLYEEERRSPFIVNLADDTNETTISLNSVKNCPDHDDDGDDNDDGIGTISSVTSVAGIEENWTPREELDVFIGEEQDDEGRTFYRCLQCQKRITLKSNARLHLRRVHYKQRFQCSKCLQKFYDTNRRRKHRLICVGPSSVVEKKVTRSSSKLRSRKVQKVSSQKLLETSTSTSDPLPVKRQPKGQKTQVISSNNEQVPKQRRPSDILEKVKSSDSRRAHWRCKICQKIMTFKGNAALHVRRVHWRERLPCTKCGQTFYDSHVLNLHKMKCTQTSNDKWQHYDDDEPTNEVAELNITHDDDNSFDDHADYEQVKLGDEVILMRNNSCRNIDLERATGVRVVIEHLDLVEDVGSCDMWLDPIEEEQEEEEEFVIKIDKVVGGVVNHLFNANVMDTTSTSSSSSSAAVDFPKFSLIN